MKVIINTINVYHIHENRYHIDNRHNSNAFTQPGATPSDGGFADVVPHVVVNNEDDENPLILALKARILQSEKEVKELLNRLDKENK